MLTEGASVVAFTQDRQRVLLHQREDFRVWTLPGGHIESGESWQETAARETLEETGYQVAIDRLVGHYWHPQMPHGGDLQHLFEGRVVGGAPISRGPETAGVGLFPITELPPRTIRWARVHIADALTNSSTVIERTELMARWQTALIQVGFVLRDYRNKYVLRRK